MKINKEFRNKYYDAICSILTSYEQETKGTKWDYTIYPLLVNLVNDMASAEIIEDD